MNSLQLIVDFLFSTLNQVASLISGNWLLLVFFGLFVLRMIFNVLYKIKKKGGL